LITGIDGPYYLIQVRSLLETGSLAYGDPPLVFYLFSFFTLILGDVTLGVKFGVAFFSALLTLSMHFLMKRVTGRTSGGYLGMLCLTFSALFIRMMSDFMKNAVGILFLLSFVYYLHSLAFIGRNWRNLSLATFFILMTGLTHILDFSVAVLFLAIYSIAAIIFNNENERTPFVRSIIVIILVLIFFVLITVKVFSFFFTDYRKILSFFEDISTVSQEKPFAPLIFPRLHGPLLPLSWSMLVGILFLGFVLAFYEKKKGKTEQFVFLLSITITGSLLGLPFIPREWLWRFMLMEFVPISIILSYGLSKVDPLLSVKIKDPLLRGFLALMIIGLCLSPLIVQAVDMRMFVRPTISYAGYLDLTEMRKRIPADSVVIAQGSLGYWVEYISRVDVARKPSPSLWQSYSHVLGLFDRRRMLPFAKRLKPVYKGRALILVEFPPPP